MDLEKDITAFDNPDYYFFWGGYCSQWAESPFEEFGEIFNCAEQFMMAAKAKVFNDEESFKKIMATNSPREQKALGRKVKNFNAETWNTVARDYVTLGNYNKFTQNEEFLDSLRKHRGKFFVEASPYDKVWGIGLGTDAEGIENPANWQGTNWLGQCINAARDLIFSEDLSSPSTIESLRKNLDWRK
jgi:hypothetical protein